jgi:aspartate carbamoyltransferase catalytic subunit
MSCPSRRRARRWTRASRLKDTALTIGAYDPDVIVLRHPHIGAPQVVARATNAHIVNAGDGTHQHPTQALLDLYTIDEELGGIAGLHVAIVGDVLHSRVARSDIQALVLMGAR